MAVLFHKLPPIGVTIFLRREDRRMVAVRFNDVRGDPARDKYASNFGHQRVLVLDWHNALTRRMFTKAMLIVLAIAAPCSPHLGTIAKLKIIFASTPHPRATAALDSCAVMIKSTPTGPIATGSIWPSVRMANAARPSTNSGP